MLRPIIAAVALQALLLSTSAAAAQGDCRQPPPVCAARGAVFVIEAFDPFASAVRISDTRLVTNRHVVADRKEATVRLPDGSAVIAQVVPTAFDGDLVLLEAQGLPPGPVLTPGGDVGGALYTVAGDLARKTVRAYPPGKLIVPPANAPTARLHHTAHSQPGNSGGALVDEAGNLAGIVASGGEGRFEAFPADRLARLQRQSGPQHATESDAVGAANRACIDAVEANRTATRVDDGVAATLYDSCGASRNRQLFDLAAQLLGRAGRSDRSLDLSRRAVARDPNAINSLLTLVVTLHTAGRYEEEGPHLRRLAELAPEEPLVARFAVQAGKWSGDQALVETGLELIRAHNPAQLEAAERFLAADVPPPARRAPSRTTPAPAPAQ